MKKTKLWNHLVSAKSKKVLASALALSMALGGAVYGSSFSSAARTLKTAADESNAEPVTFMTGDINNDQKVDLEDASLALRAALKIIELNTQQSYAADVDSNGKVELTDAQLILKAALKIEPLPSKEPPAESEAPTTSEQPGVSETPVQSETPKPEPTIPTIPPKPTPPPVTPKPEVPYVEPKEENVVSGQSVQVKKLNGAQQEGDALVFGPRPTPATGQAASDVEAYGVEMVNPFAGRTDLCEKPEDVIRTERVNDKPTVWELSGASVKAASENSLDGVDIKVANAEPKGYQFCDQENYDYTRPEWKKGMSFSFWVNSDSKTGGDPVLVFENNQCIFSLRLNGSIRFLDSLSNKERNSLNNESSSIKSSRNDGRYDKWNYYTVTIANDWVQVYVNGQENVYSRVCMNRSLIQLFNDGFLTRYNPTAVVNQQMADEDIRTYYTRLDSTGHMAWYYNPDTEKYEGHDDFSIFVNNRFRGANTGALLLMDFLTDTDTVMWIGGTTTNIEPTSTNRLFEVNTNVVGIKAYDKELTAEEVAACYAYDAATPEAVLTWDPNKQDEEEPTNPGTSGSAIQIEKLNNWADYDEQKGIVTFKAPEGLASKVTGVKIKNPFAGHTELREDVRNALSGQAIFPYLTDNGGTISDPSAAGGAGNVACVARSVEVRRGNFYDVYYGDVEKLGDAMDNPTGTNLHDAKIDSIKSQEELEANYKKTTFQRPQWSTGATISFWAKPVEIDDSPLLTFHMTSNMLLVISVRGDVCYYSLNANGKDWGKGVSATGEPHNAFSALGDPSFVKEGEWNYYTVTLANDWIQVYVNGEEMVYSKLNLNRQYLKEFNCGYLSRYNTIGIWNSEMLKKNGDPSGKTLEGKERNYLTKSNYFYDFSRGDVLQDSNEGPAGALSDKGINSGKDSASIRMNGIYANPYRNGADENTGKTLMYYLTMGRMELYLGGVPSAVSLEKEFFFSDLKMTDEDDKNEELRKKVHFNKKVYNQIQIGTDENGNIIYGDSDVEAAVSLCKFFYSDHLLDEGTQVAGVSSELSELSAEEVKTKYNEALETKPAQ